MEQPPRAVPADERRTSSYKLVKHIQMLVAQNSLGPVCPVPLTVRGIRRRGAKATPFVGLHAMDATVRSVVGARRPHELGALDGR